MAASRVVLYAGTTPIVPASPKLRSASASAAPYAKLWIRRRSLGSPVIKCKALRDGTSLDPATTNTVYQGVYGPWTVDPTDVREVISYRAGLVTAAASFVVAASTAFLPQDSDVGAFIKHNLDVFYIVGGAGLGVSLLLIHIYVTQIKRTIQALWGLGAVASLVTYTTLAAPAGQGLVQYVVQNPNAVWFVGPFFAALTGLVFKEGKLGFYSFIVFFYTVLFFFLV